MADRIQTYTEATKIQFVFLRVFYMMQRPYHDKSVCVLYKEDMVTFYISKYESYLTEYKQNKEITKR